MQKSLGNNQQNLLQLQAQINQEGCDRKGIRHKTEGYGGCVDGCFLSWLGNPTEMMPSTEFLSPLHQQNPET